MKETPERMRDAETFLRNCLERNFGQKVSESDLRYAAQKLVKSMPEPG